MSRNSIARRSKDYFALYLYGELSFDEEERVESHLDACADCRKALERQREVQMALDNIGDRARAVAVAFLPRGSALSSGRGRGRRAAGAKRGWWEQFTDTLTGRSGSGWLKPAGALTLVALGFGARALMPQALQFRRSLRRWA